MSDIYPPNKISMVDLKSQYNKIKPEIDSSVINTIEASQFIGGPIVYYPIPLYKQEAFSCYVNHGFQLVNTEILCNEVLSLPMHSELEESTQEYIIRKIKTFFNG